MVNNKVIALLLIGIWGQLLIIGGYLIGYFELLTGGTKSQNNLIYIFNPYSLCWVALLMICTYIVYNKPQK